MYISETKVRVRYAETDQMGYVYYGNYAAYVETGRVEALRQLNLSYKEMEERGIMLPVLNMNVKYIKPAFYDDLLTIKTIINEMPEARMKFDYNIYNVKGELINISFTEHVFVDIHKRIPTRVPVWLKEALSPYF